MTSRMKQCQGNSLSGMKDPLTSESLLPTFTYLHAALLSMIVASASIRFAPDELLSRYQPSFVALAYVGFFITLILWLRQSQLPRWPGKTMAQLLLLVGVWAISIAVSLTQGSVFYLSAYILPLLLVLVLLKPLRERQVLSAVDLLAWSLLFYLVLTYLVDVIGFFAGDAFHRFRTDLGEDRVWNPMHIILGIEGRWSGPLGHPNKTALPAAFLVVYSASRLATRLPMFAIAVYLLLATASVTSILAAIAGLSLLLTLRLIQRLDSLRSQVTFALMSMAVVSAGCGLLLFSNPTLTGRTTIWPRYLELGVEWNLMGSGDIPIGRSLESGDLPQWAGHAHNLFLDMLVRYGLVALLLLLVLFASLFYSSLLAARSGSNLALCLLVMLLVANIAEVGIDPRYWDFGTALTVTVTLLSGTALPNSRSLIDPNANSERL